LFQQLARAPLAEHFFRPVYGDHRKLTYPLVTRIFAFLQVGFRAPAEAGCFPRPIFHLATATGFFQEIPESIFIRGGYFFRH
jgi:hypothetical protein